MVASRGPENAPRMPPETLIYLHTLASDASCSTTIGVKINIELIPKMAKPTSRIGIQFQNGKTRIPYPRINSEKFKTNFPYFCDSTNLHK